MFCHLLYLDYMARLFGSKNLYTELEKKAYQNMSLQQTEPEAWFPSRSNTWKQYMHCAAAASCM
jgi:hypothetical protein